MSGPKCLRCGAGSEWIEGRAPVERRKRSLAQVPGSALPTLREIIKWPSDVPVAVAMTDQPWPLRDVLTKLVESSEILLGFYDYRGDGWEQIHQAIERGKAALSNWPNRQ